MNGKTMTTTLTGEIFKNSGRRTYVAGNIGTAVISAATTADENDWLVTETSSFQLETTRYFRPVVSAVLNITPDHLNRHRTMEAYAGAKAKIFANQSGESYLVTANNTVAIIVDGAMAKDISKRYEIDPRTTASILDIFSCIFQGLIPYGAQFLLIASLTKGRVSPMEVIPCNWYLFLLGGFTILSFFFPAYERLTLKGKWNWDENRPVAAPEK